MTGEKIMEILISLIEEQDNIKVSGVVFRADGKERGVQTGNGKELLNHSAKGERT